MAQLTNVGQGQQATLGPLVSSIMLLMSLVMALLGIKIWGFRRRLTFDSSNGRSSTRAAQQQPQSAPRYAAYESQVNGTDNAVHGVFRQRNTEEFESAKPTNSTGKKYLAVSVPNLQLAPYEYREESSIPELTGTVTHRPHPEAARRRHRDVRSSSYDYYSKPPTRQPPAPPITVQATEPPSQLDIPNFDHFAEKYKLISVKAGSEEGKKSQPTTKERGRYIKYEQVDDVPELLTPDDDQVGAAISVAAQVHQLPGVAQAKSLLEVEPESEPKPEWEPKPESEPKMEPQPKAEPELNLKSIRDGERLELEHTESAFVVEIIAGTPDSTDQTKPVITRNFFADLELPHHVDDVEFERIRSSYEMNEADILDMQPDFTALQTELRVPRSPPGFGKTIDDDWENFENLESVANAEVLELPRTEQCEVTHDFENLVQEEDSFGELKLVELVTPIDELRTQRTANALEPPPYDMRPPAPPILPDYESVMQLEVSRANRKLPNYEDAVGQGKGRSAKYVNSIEDMLVELQVNGNSSPLATEVHDFDKLCEELEIAPSPVPARRPPQPAPRVSKPATLSVRGDAAPLTCYEPDELPSSSSSEAEGEEIAAPPPPPQPAKREARARALKVRFDVENLQYYQSAEVPSSNESDIEFDSAGDQSERVESEREMLPPRATQRLIPLLPEEPESLSTDRDIPELFSSQISQEDSDDELFGRAIRQHRSMTEALRPAAGLDHTTQSDRITEA